MAALAISAVVPVHAAPSLHAEQVTQLVLGEGARVGRREGAHLAVVTILDGCRGWVHEGYLQMVDPNAAEGWLATAGWSEGAEVEVAGARLRVPHRGRVQLEGDRRIRLPGGGTARLTGGSIRPYGEVMRSAVEVPAAEWVWREFGGVPYLAGGVSSFGIDAPGLVQLTFLARGIPLPRHAGDQAALGTAIDREALRGDDLVFFDEADTGTVSHVAIAASADAIVHATVAHGMVTREAIVPGSAAAPLMERAVAFRRLG